MREPGVVDVTTWVGSGVPRFYLPLDQIFPQSNVSQLIIQPKDLATRETLRVKLPALLARSSPRCAAASSCCPTARRCRTRCSSAWSGRPGALRERADEVKAVMRAEPQHARRQRQLERVGEGAAPGGRPGQGARAGRHQPVDRAGQPHHPVGTNVGQYREGDKLIDIVLRQPLDERNAITDIANAYLPTSLGQVDPADADRQAGVHLGAGRDVARGPQLRHHGAGRHRRRPAGRDRHQGTAAEAEGAGARVAAGYRIQVAGAVEESGKGSSSIAAGVPIMLFITFTLLMLQLHSFSRAMLVFLTGPLGIAGVAGALLLLNRPFGFVALLGVIALMGMIQRNSVILIDQIEQDRARGVPAWDAIVESAVRRLRPIVLTAAAAVLAMIPLSRSVFWGPMAVAIMGGLIVATVLTLLALPAMYAAWFRVKREGA
jgi:multidrug efflux pump